MKKRVLQFTGSFRQGGSERQAVALSVLLKQQGEFEVLLASLSNDGPLLDVAVKAGFGDVPEFALTSFYGPNFFRQVLRCAKYLRENKIDVIHTHDFYTNVFGMAVATLARTPARIASKRETFGMRSKAQEMIEGIAFGRANAIVVNSAAVRDHLTGLGISREKIRLIYNGIDTKRFEFVNNDVSTRDQLAMPADAKIVTLVANLRHDVKNVPMFLRAAKRIVGSHPSTHFVVAGEGELQSSLRQTANEMSIAENMHIIGRCSEIPALLSASDVCVLTSTAEGFSNSILEYMAAGKPVVATNVGGAAEAIVDGETGFLVASDDDSAMAVHVSQLLADSETAARFGAEGRRRVTGNFSTESQLLNTIALYNSLLA